MNKPVISYLCICLMTLGSINLSYAVDNTSAITIEEHQAQLITIMKKKRGTNPGAWYRFILQEGLDWEGNPINVDTSYKIDEQIADALWIDEVRTKMTEVQFQRYMHLKSLEEGGDETVKIVVERIEEEFSIKTYNEIDVE